LACLRKPPLFAKGEIIFSVIPAKAGIQYSRAVVNYLDSGACPGHDPGFAEVTNFTNSSRVIFQKS
jgi:hypothetical protein